jgi:ssDNA-binding Zn-finger/Zn-ribbon topoisomerase 1
MGIKGYDEETDESYEIHELRAETERLKGEVAFFDNRCPRCNSTLGLLHESECPLCNSRSEVERLREALREIGAMADAPLCQRSWMNVRCVVRRAEADRPVC